MRELAGYALGFPRFFRRSVCFRRSGFPADALVDFWLAFRRSFSSSRFSIKCSRSAGSGKCLLMNRPSRKRPIGLLLIANDLGTVQLIDDRRQRQLIIVKYLALGRGSD